MVFLLNGQEKVMDATEIDGDGEVEMPRISGDDGESAKILRGERRSDEKGQNSLILQLSRHQFRWERDQHRIQ